MVGGYVFTSFEAFGADPLGGVASIGWPKQSTNQMEHFLIRLLTTLTFDTFSWFSYLNQPSLHRK